MKWFDRLRASLGKARETFAGVQRLGNRARPLTREFWDELEEALILADFGVPTSQKIVSGLQTVAKQEAWKTTDQAVARFRKDVERFLTLPSAELRLDRRPSIDARRRRQRQRQNDHHREACDATARTKASACRSSPPTRSAPPPPSS